MTTTTKTSLQQHFNYCVAFSDHTVKTGITSAPFYRLQDFMQEARRHGKRVTDFNITPPGDKRAALRIERAVCAFFDVYAIDGHREWFSPDLTFYRPRMRKSFADGLRHNVRDYMRSKWDEAHAHAHLIERCRARREGRKSTVHDYGRVIEFAAMLPRDAGRISAAKSTALAAEMVLV